MSFFDALCGIIILEKVFFQLREKRVINCFKPLVLSVFATIAYRLKSEQKEKEK